MREQRKDQARLPPKGKILPNPSPRARGSPHPLAREKNTHGRARERGKKVGHEARASERVSLALFGLGGARIKATARHLEFARGVFGFR